MDTVILIMTGVLSRLLPHPSNMTAIGGIAVFSGAKYYPVKALLITILAMILSDAVLGFHPLMWATYGSLAVAVCIGAFSGRGTVRRATGGVILSSVIFFVLTNFAVWAQTPMYPKTLSGLIECYIAAIPFFRNSLIGDMATSAVLFAAYASGVRYFGSLKLHKAHA